MRKQKKPVSGKTQERLAILERQVERVERLTHKLDLYNNQWWTTKLGIIFAGVVLFVLGLNIFRVLGFVFVLLAIIAFLLAERSHEKVRKSFLRAQFLLRVQRHQIARIRLDWRHIPTFYEEASGEEDHPFEYDLDITGERSLHRLLNTGVSAEGGRRLLGWLLNRTPDLETIRERQVMIRELMPMTLFREKLMLHSLMATRVSAEEWEGEQLLEWLQTPHQQPVTTRQLVLPTILSLWTLASVLLFMFYHTPILSFVVPGLLSLGYYLSTRRSRGKITVDAFYLFTSLNQLHTIFEFLESYRYGQHLNLKRLCEPFYRRSEYRPSVLLRKLSRLSNAARLESSEVLGLIVNTLLPWDVYVAFFLQRYKAQVAQLLPDWLEIWFELEALCSLANFAYLNPDYIIPDVVKTSPGQETSVFHARGLGHPLIPVDKKVVNDFDLERPGEVLLITGSNMAGKSTFLRTLGINLCLAYAGGPVNADTFQVSLFEIYACIRVTDSLADGYSYFYAEVRRLRGLLTRLEEKPPYPIFFLIDEIFKGTNNRERLIGSTAYIHALVGQHCVGAISTHDLELVKLAETLPEIRNFHFREDVVNGQMVFDYKLREGPCPTTNALKIMQMEGLPVTF